MMSPAVSKPLVQIPSSWVIENRYLNSLDTCMRIRGWEPCLYQFEDEGSGKTPRYSGAYRVYVPIEGSENLEPSQGPAKYARNLAEDRSVCLGRHREALEGEAAISEMDICMFSKGWVPKGVGANSKEANWRRRSVRPNVLARF
jgi:hypothetical protein